MCKTRYPKMTWVVTVDGEHTVVLQIRISIRARYPRNGEDDIDTLFGLFVCRRRFQSEWMSVVTLFLAVLGSESTRESRVPEMT